jgi:hypothetical protein
LNNQDTSFYAVITAAVNDIAEHGFDSQKRIDDWLIKIRRAALASLVSPALIEKDVKAVLVTVYETQVVKGKIAGFHPELAKAKIDLVKPKLRSELDRRILANAQLIRMNREEAVARTLRRFAGWATSVPKGGSDAIEKLEVKKTIRKALAQLPYEERRVAIDQGAKFISSLNLVIAQGNHAIGGIWHSRWRRPGYNYREDHKERDEKIYTMRGNWALNDGLMKVGPAGYTDQVTQPGEEPFCSCSYQYLYNLSSLPETMLTAKGRKLLHTQQMALTP